MLFIFKNCYGNVPCWMIILKCEYWGNCLRLCQSVDPPLSVSAVAAKCMTAAVFAGYFSRPQGHKSFGSQIPAKNPISHISRLLFPEFQDNDYTMLNFGQNVHASSKFYLSAFKQYPCFSPSSPQYSYHPFPTFIILQLPDSNPIIIHSDLEIKPKVLQALSLTMK